MNLVGELMMEGIDGGLRVKRVGETYVDILDMLYGYRIVATPVEFPLLYGRFYCYTGRGAHVYAAAVLAAQLWDPTDGSEPLGWNKNGQTGAWRPPTDPPVVTLSQQAWERFYAYLEEDDDG